MAKFSHIIILLSMLSLLFREGWGALTITPSVTRQDAPDTTAVSVGNFVAADAASTLNWSISCNLCTLTLNSFTGVTGSTTSLIMGTGTSQDDFNTALTGVQYTLEEQYRGDTAGSAEIVDTIDYVRVTAYDGATYATAETRVATGTQELPFDGCANNDLRGAGICNNHGYCDQTTYTCVCDYPYYGTSCTRLYCKEDCIFVPNSFCSASTGLCICTSGYSGDYCQYKACPEATCNGNGDCDSTTGVCTCHEGYFGNVCDLMTCPDDCNEHGLCDNSTGTCTCESGYEGDACQLKTCAQDCGEVGYCNKMLGVCECPPGFDTDNDCMFTTCAGCTAGEGLCNELTGFCSCEENQYGYECDSTYDPNA